jgi:hypothetical protein
VRDPRIRRHHHIYDYSDRVDDLFDDYDHDDQGHYYDYDDDSRRKHRVQ